MLSPIGWLDGLTALAVVSVGLIFGAISFYKAIKLKAPLLGITGLATISVGFILLGATVDLVFILITNDNLSPAWLYALLSYTWTAPITIFGLYIGASLLKPKKKKLIISIYAVLSVIFEFIVFYYTFTDPTIIYRFPAVDPAGTALLNTSMNPRSIAFFFMIAFLVSGLIFNGFGFLKKSFSTTGALKRKFLYLSFGWIIFIICGALDGLLETGVATFFIRIGIVSSIVLMYLGVKS